MGKNNKKTPPKAGKKRSPPPADERPLPSLLQSQTAQLIRDIRDEYPATPRTKQTWKDAHLRFTARCDEQAIPPLTLDEFTRQMISRDLEAASPPKYHLHSSSDDKEDG